MTEGFIRVYESLPDNETQTKAAQNGEEISIRRERTILIVNPPMLPLSPVGPKRGMYLLLGIVGGAVLGFLFGGPYEWRRWKETTT
ncbi:MAG: hypothetical protein IPJ30_17610 [Acidobacteria bacterium]|nr:hypothetical protein [Acidobacteriota bacterium]MBK8151439.1 hypothetical protein [Acidobacteriota bacterium]